MTTFGTNLRTARKALGLTQEALAERAGVRRSTISDIETGKEEALFVTMQRLAAALGTTVSHLTRGEQI